MSAIPARPLDPLPVIELPLTAHLVADRYLDHKRRQAKLGHCCVERLRGEERYLRSLASLFPDRPAADIRNSDLEDWLERNPSWRSPSTVYNAIAAVVCCWRWAFDEGLIERNRINRRKLRLRRPHPRKPIELADYRRLMASVRWDRRSHRPSRLALRIAVFFMWESGARTCEMREACWHHVDWVRRWIELDKHKTDRTGRTRKIPLSRVVFRLLAWIKRKRMPKESEPIFLNGRWRPWNRSTFCRLFRKYARRAGIRPGLTGYCLRHGFVCRALEAGLGERRVADMAGQETTRYVAWYADSLRSKSEWLIGGLEKMRQKK